MAYRQVWTGQPQRWLRGLKTADAARLAPSLDALAAHGLAASSNHVKQIKSSRHHPNMYELRSVGGNLRVLFAIDGPDTAVMLHGGDKTGQWNAWYDKWVRVADARLDARRRSTGKEAACRSTRIGTRSAARDI